MDPGATELQPMAVHNQDSIQTSEASGNLAQSIQALFASSDPASQLQLLQAVGAVPPTSAPQMVLLPASVGSSSVVAGSWPQQYVVVPGLNQFVLAASDASTSSAQAVLLASLGAQAAPNSGLLTVDMSTASPLGHQAVSSPAHLLNGVQLGAHPQPTLSTIAENQLTQPTNLPKPPVKPLSAYMSFSKAIWPQVKSSHTNASVCEIGAIIGQMWNDLDEVEKKRYNDNYAVEKAKYTKDLQVYLQATGLKASDLVKPKSRKGRVQAKTAAPSVPVVDDGGRGGLPHFSQVWASGAGPHQVVAAGHHTSTATAGTASYSEYGRQGKAASAAAAASSSSQSDVGVETELRGLREAVSNVTREAEFLKRQLNEAFAYIRQLEEQQASVLSELTTANVQTPSVGAV